MSSLGVFGEVLGQNQRLVCRALLENSWATILEQSCSGILDLLQAFFKDFVAPIKLFFGLL